MRDGAVGSALYVSTTTTAPTSIMTTTHLRRGVRRFLKHILLLLAPIALPAILSWFHHVNWWKTHQCLLIGYYYKDDDQHHHVDQYCHRSPATTTTTTMTGVVFRSYPTSVAPTVLELSEWRNFRTVQDGLDQHVLEHRLHHSAAHGDHYSIKVEWKDEEIGGAAGAVGGWNVLVVPPITADTNSISGTKKNQYSENDDGQPVMQLLDFSSSTSLSWSRKKNKGGVLAMNDANNNDDNNNNNNNNNPSQMTAYGFRRNSSRHQNQSINRNRNYVSSPIPMATGWILVMNIGMYLWLWNMKVDPSHVALNVGVPQRFLSDLGRSLTGHVSHFELWHIGFNMMTLANLGPDLEIRQGGFIPFLLWNLSLLPLTTLVVLGLHKIHQRILLFVSARQRRQGHNDGSSTTTSTMPPPPSSSSMVGFSGILFAWMVLSTLDGRRSCPIFFLPDLCFDTFEVTKNGIRISLGPLVQLVVLQVILPRVSFIGHLAGILVGFLWHWNLLPPLEWIQPCILYPLLWMIGKWWYYGVGQSSSSSSSASSISSIPSSWRLEGSSNSRKNDDLAAILGRLSLLRNSWMVHVIVSALVLGWRWTISEIPMIWILSSVVQGAVGSRQHVDNRSGMERFGTTGRAYVFLAMILLATDGLQLGAWVAIAGLWSNLRSASMLLLLRDVLLLLSISLTTSGLQLMNETTNVGQQGTWNLFVWPMARHCFLPVGKWLQSRVICCPYCPAGYLCGKMAEEESSSLSFAKPATTSAPERKLEDSHMQEIETESV